MGEYWRDVKEHYREKQKRYEQKISGVYQKLCNHPLHRKAGDHHRIDVWDFWYTGTVRNYKTGENISLQELLNKYPN